jgi:hypothetical protein
MNTNNKLLLFCFVLKVANIAVVCANEQPSLKLPERLEGILTTPVAAFLSLDRLYLLGGAAAFTFIPYFLLLLLFSNYISRLGRTFPFFMLLCVCAGVAYEYKESPITSAYVLVISFLPSVGILSVLVPLSGAFRKAFSAKFLPPAINADPTVANMAQYINYCKSRLLDATMSNTENFTMIMRALEANWEKLKIYKAPSLLDCMANRPKYQMEVTEAMIEMQSFLKNTFQLLDSIDAVAESPIKTRVHDFRTKRQYMYQNVVEVLVAADFATQECLEEILSDVSSKMRPARKADPAKGEDFIDRLIDLFLVRVAFSLPSETDLTKIKEGIDNLRLSYKSPRYEEILFVMYDLGNGLGNIMCPDRFKIYLEAQKITKDSPVEKIDAFKSCILDHVKAALAATPNDKLIEYHVNLCTYKDSLKEIKIIHDYLEEFSNMILHLKVALEGIWRPAMKSLDELLYYFGLFANRAKTVIYEKDQNETKKKLLEIYKAIDIASTRVYVDCLPASRPAQIPLLKEVAEKLEAANKFSSGLLLPSSGSSVEGGQPIFDEMIAVLREKVIEFKNPEPIPACALGDKALTQEEICSYFKALGIEHGKPQTEPVVETALREFEQHISSLYYNANNYSDLIDLNNTLKLVYESALRAALGPKNVGQVSNQNPFSAYLATFLVDVLAPALEVNSSMDIPDWPFLKKLRLFRIYADRALRAVHQKARDFSREFLADLATSIYEDYETLGVCVDSSNAGITYLKDILKELKKLGASFTCQQLFFTEPQPVFSDLVDTLQAKLDACST